MDTWMAALSLKDRLKLKARLELAGDDPLKRQEEMDYFKEVAEDPAYLALKAVRAGSQLQPKDIALPDVSTADDSPLEGFMRQCYTQDEYATRGEFYASLQEDRIREWTETVRAFETEPNDFYNAWQYLDTHPAHWRFRGDDGMTAPEERITEWNLCAEYGVNYAVDICVTKVNSATGRREDDRDNTLTEVWIELGKTNWPGPPEEGDYICKGEIYPRDHSYHDPTLDCGGESMEAAIIAAAVSIHTHYGNDRRICDKEPDSVSGNG
jgi:hypothetical protein